MMAVTHSDDSPLTQQSLNILPDTLAGVLSWSELDTIWNKIIKLSDAGWYLTTPDNPNASAISNSKDVISLVKFLRPYLRKTHEYKYCGIVYVDSFTQPTLIRVFDPKELTSMCNISGSIPGPSWVFTTQSPKEMSLCKEAPSKFQHQEVGKVLKTVNKHPQAVDILDARKMGCPLPLVNTARALRQIEVGEWLEIISFEPSAVNDIRSICEFTGHKHIAQATGDYGYSFYIQRMHKLKRLPVEVES